MSTALIHSLIHLLIPYSSGTGCWAAFRAPGHRLWDQALPISEPQLPHPLNGHTVPPAQGWLRGWSGPVQGCLGVLGGHSPALWCPPWSRSSEPEPPSTSSLYGLRRSLPRTEPQLSGADGENHTLSGLGMVTPFCQECRVPWRHLGSHWAVFSSAESG